MQYSRAVRQQGHRESILLILLYIVRTQFVSEWESPQGDHPTIEKLYEIIVPRDVRNSHAAYGYGTVIHLVPTSEPNTRCFRKQLSSAKEIRTFHSKWLAANPSLIPTTKSRLRLRVHL